MIRLDKYLSERNIGTRSQIKELLKKGQVTVNEKAVRDGAVKIEEGKDEVRFQNTLLRASRFRYYMLYKPAGVVTATKDNVSGTVMDLLKVAGKEELFPVGRLDKDTEGLLLLTNDGELAHQLLSPKKHVSKTYYVKAEKEVTEAQARCLREGVDIGDEKQTLPAHVEILKDRELLLTITEGRFHQIKRMFHAVNNQVLYLKRVQMGTLVLDTSLKPGEYRELSEEEIEKLKG